MIRPTAVFTCLTQAEFGVGSRCLCQASFDNNAQRKWSLEVVRCLYFAVDKSMSLECASSSHKVCSAQVLQRSSSVRWLRMEASPTMSITWIVSSFASCNLMPTQCSSHWQKCSAEAFTDGKGQPVLDVQYCVAVDKRLDEWVSQDRLVQLNGCTQMDVLTPRMASLPILPQCAACCFSSSFASADSVPWLSAFTA